MGEVSKGYSGSFRAQIVAEGVGFEPTIPGGIPVFKTGAFVRSAIPPSKLLYRQSYYNGFVCCIRAFQGWKGFPSGKGARPSFVST